MTDRRCHTTTTAGALAVVSTARAETLKALERLSDDRSAAADATDAVVALQVAANQLGVAEQVLADRPAVDADDVTWTGEAMAVLALAEMSVPYASGPADEVDDWLRALRREGHGTVGRALAELGFPDGELVARAEPVASPRHLQRVEAVRTKAWDLALGRRAVAVTTADVLFAVFAEYPSAFVKRALYERGIDERALLEQIAGGRPAAAIHAQAGGST